jgi:hypothetical protein
VGSITVLTDEEVAQLRTELTRLGVAAASQNSLLEKLELGLGWDSLTPGAVPIAQDRATDGNTLIVTDRYADGSVAVSSTSIPSGSSARTDEPSSRGVSQCASTGSSGYAWYWINCLADVDLGVIDMYFRFDYQNVNGPGLDITNYYAYGHRRIGCSLSNFRFDRMSRTDVRLSTDFDFAFQGFPVGWTDYMGVRVTTTGTSTYYN